MYRMVAWKGRASLVETTFDVVVKGNTGWAEYRRSLSLSRGKEANMNCERYGQKHVQI